METTSSPNVADSGCLQNVEPSSSELSFSSLMNGFVHFGLYGLKIRNE